MDQDTIKSLLTRYPNVIGGGIDGVVRTGDSPPYDSVAVKFYRENNKKSICERVIYSSMVNRIIDRVFHRFMESSPISNMHVQRVYKLIRETESKDNSFFSCAVLTERLLSPMDIPYFVSQKSYGAINIRITDTVYEYTTTDISNPTVIETRMGTRGFIYNQDAIRQLLNIKSINPTGLTIENIVYRIGALEAISIFGAGYLSRANYVLDIMTSYISGARAPDIGNMGAGVRVTMSDFDMSININDIIEQRGMEYVASKIGKGKNENLSPVTFDMIDDIFNPDMTDLNSFTTDLAKYISNIQIEHSGYHPSIAKTITGASDIRKSYLDGFTIGYMEFETIGNRLLYDAMMVEYNM